MPDPRPTDERNTLRTENERLTARAKQLEEDLEQHSENWRVKAGHLEQERDRLREALKAMIIVMDRGPCPRKLEEALSWRECDEKARALADAALHPTKPAPEETP
jgi:DNA repair exonuclease SbcCD ATPase subunit